MTTTTPSFTQEVPAWAVGLLIEKVAKANRKAARNGMGEPFGYSVEPFTVTKKVSGIEVTTNWAHFTITGESNGLAGWTYAAKATWDTEIPVLNVSPFHDSSITLPTPTSRVCDHCGTIRSRVHTHLVVGPDGEVKQVGTSCLTVYTGINVGWVSLGDDLVASEEDLDNYRSHWSPTYNTQSLLVLAVRIIDALGYMSYSGSGVPTRQRFTIAMHGPIGNEDVRIDRETKDALELRTRTDAEVQAEVDAILAWALTLGGEASEYLRNLYAILREEDVTYRNLGYALSAVTAYRRETERVVAAAAVAATRTPVVEGRQTITGTIESLRVQYGDFGPQTKIKVTTDSGSVVWGTLPAAISSAVVGDRLQFTATVKASTDDNTFGFYSRPVKAQILA
jgi:hypothetical protein